MASAKLFMFLVLAAVTMATALPAERAKKDVILGTYPYAYSYPYATYTAAAAPVAYAAAYYHPSAYSALPLPAYRTVIY